MRTATTALRIEPDLKRRAEVLAESERRSLASVVRDALESYLARREAEQTEIREALAAWEDFQQTGQHLTGQETSAWLRTWGTEDESGAPECRR